MQEEMNQKQQVEEKKPKTWDEAILELKGFILNAKKEETRQKEEKHSTQNLKNEL